MLFLPCPLSPHVTAYGRHHDHNGTHNASGSRPQRQQDATGLSDVHSFAQRLDELLLLRCHFAFKKQFHHFSIFEPRFSNIVFGELLRPNPQTDINAASTQPTTTSNVSPPQIATSGGDRNIKNSPSSFLLSKNGIVFI